MITVTTLKQLKAKQEKITMLTCYDASFARVMETAGIEILLIGDSLGMTVQGHTSTLPVTLEQMIYHTQNVARGNQTALLLADLPFGTYEADTISAYQNAAALMKAGAHMVKLEGGMHQVEKTAYLTARSIPVCAHLGLTPQSVNTLGGYRVQGRDESAAEALLTAAKAHEAAGAALLVLECIPAPLAKTVTAALSIPVIGIGAGKDCDGQVLVLQDLLGIYPKPPKFSKNFLQGQDSILAAISSYIAAVKAGTFPESIHTFEA
ncbi:3-methyl-2-oxobutanoate hydroxymethyltransferase [Wohlfahrtiimonas chitiniclastica]|uniref:3-methyl-2-oxobutanoate hydroxymethyltransferase n=1 Tax=Wohlfahrtiimonas chitiniclastica TaxID=400946 RepID=UPI000B98D37B|nr:3-methyl-2-oxobutanoate hydroxymethyltransferase [Wohlfahrtiimonas chitiniclastica]OYQ70704.1 3-methyl-2-oxobutanoate hydroxymethyltransferase [Wohlfahrtiimonas chitiniclastica]OYQ83909.1 3-methyl-2-oxobutanoate hydroxymethyltransferase [Wohlfahrtiimonas chitiniclastica]OYQ84748.1 3-methyl-2-oxobutanoate hydroxymethyltransferase [Wohlfahrtiimonas chitiniclastica]